MRICVALLLAMGMSRGWCGLEFEEPILHLRSVPSEHRVEGVFRFRNTGKAPVTITRVKTSCGCTTARLEKERYEPGEAGEVKTVFKYGFEKGRLRKLLSVLTDDPQTPEIPLEIRVAVEEPVEIVPQLVYWRKGEAAVTKTVRVTVQPEWRVRSVAADDSAFEVRLREGGSPAQWEIEVTPKGTGRRAGAKIELVTEEDGQMRSYRAYARVK